MNEKKCDTGHDNFASNRILTKRKVFNQRKAPTQKKEEFKKKKRSNNERFRNNDDVRRVLLGFAERMNRVSPVRFVDFICLLKQSVMRHLGLMRSRSSARFPFHRLRFQQSLHWVSCRSGIRTKRFSSIHEVFFCALMGVHRTDVIWRYR